ncbi:hypothetical protein ATANTOWER_019119 [Ataeniobius toweri]|uniref:Uncharacterized protein n=1 Tax=Ataeniobius toweri TaxID=208326 RepID=A0ABU7C2G4_9TELE|nr:hypothetical protein [Ataeniobius toweri]
MCLYYFSGYMGDRKEQTETLSCKEYSFHRRYLWLKIPCQIQDSSPLFLLNMDINAWSFRNLKIVKARQ